MAVAEEKKKAKTVYVTVPSLNLLAVRNILLPKTGLV